MGMFPKLNGKSHLGVKIPSLSGGLNEFDAVNLVDDNQLTLCENMWFDGGMLKTRPGFVTNPAWCFKIATPNNGDLIGIKYINNNVYKQIGEQLYRLVAGFVENEYYSSILFWYVRGDDDEKYIVHLPEIALNKAMYDETFKNGLITQYKEYIYLYLKTSLIDVETENYKPKYSVWRIKNDWENVKFEGNMYQPINEDGKIVEWEEVTDFEVPLTMTNCRKSQSLGISGDSVRSYNLLNGGEKIEMFMFKNFEFKIDFPLQKSSKVSMSITKTDGTKNDYICELGSDYGFYNSDKAEDNTVFTVTLKEDYTYFSLRYINNELFSPDDFTPYQTDQPNVTLTYYREVSEEEKDRIFMATRCEWFGTEGLNGGSRLFVGGNKNEKHKNLLHYSDSLNPLYFPENCYMRVGDNSQAITALAKQSEMLVIFSERQLHYITYQSGVNVTPEDITENGQYDLTVLNATFPLTQINDKIGCDCPDTVQLCRNRLVWATSEGEVYTLLSANQYSERNIYKLSNNIERSLKNIHSTELKRAKSCDWENRYFLYAEGKLFIMHYDDNAFSYISSYSDSQKAQKSISWYIWDYLPEFEHFYTDGTRLIGISRGHRWNVVYICDGKKEMDVLCVNQQQDREGWGGDGWVAEITERTIPAMLQTKIFDFNNPGTKKSVDQVYIGFGGNGEKEINVTFVSEKGEQYRSFFPHCADTTPFSAGYVSVQRFLPCLAHITRLGIKIESKGNLAINNITINYRLLGGVR